MNPTAAPPCVVGSTAPADLVACWLGGNPVVIEPLAALEKSPPWPHSTRSPHPAAADGIHGLPSGDGLSGAPMWLVRRPGSGAWVLKRVAGAEARDRAAWVHALVHHARVRGVGELPAAAATPTGATLVGDAAGDFWELVDFMPGTAVETPSEAQVASALDLLARIHAVWQDAPAPPGGRCVPRSAKSRCDIPPAVARRIGQISGLQSRAWSDRRAVLGESSDPLVAAIVGLWDQALAIFRGSGGRTAVARVMAMSPEPLALQPVIRDVWYPHLLFAPPVEIGGESPRRQLAAAAAEPGSPWAKTSHGGLVPPTARVMALVDLHAAGVDTPATDLARLVGSWWRADRHGPSRRWLAAVTEVYAGGRPLSASERDLVPWLHAAGVLCGLDNWFRWVAEEKRSFSSPTAVLARATRLLEALPDALESLAR